MKRAAYVLFLLSLWTCKSKSTYSTWLDRIGGELSIDHNCPGILFIPSRGCYGCLQVAEKFAVNNKLTLVFITSKAKEYRLKLLEYPDQPFGWISYEDARALNLSTEFPSWVVLQKMEIKSITRLDALNIHSELERISFELGIK